MPVPLSPAFVPPPLPCLTAALSRLPVSLHSRTPSYLLQVWVLDCNQILSPVKGGGEISLWARAAVLGDLLAQWELCVAALFCCQRKKPGVLEDAHVCWELIGESAKGMSLM